MRSAQTKTLKVYVQLSGLILSLFSEVICQNHFDTAGLESLYTFQTRFQQKVVAEDSSV
jgi:hypothetical protein